MIELRGSQKQIEWAESLRRQYLDCVAAVVEQAAYAAEIGLGPSCTTPSVESCKRVQAEMTALVEACDNAAQIIAWRDRATYAFFNKRALAYALEVRHE